MDCHCKAGFLTCRRNLTINFPGYYYGFYEHIENCAQPQCNVAKFVREKRDHCEGVEFTIGDGIYYKGQTWKYAGCDFYFPGAYEKQGVCPAMTRPVCYVYNGAICCATECSGINLCSCVCFHLLINILVFAYCLRISSVFIILYLPAP